MSSICENLALVNEKIQNACNSAKRKRDEITLIAVSKTFPASVITDALSCGQTVFGENKVQESEEKRIALGNTKWELHLIGHLQSNKVNKAVQYCDFIHSVDSVSLAQKINNASENYNKSMPILLQINTSNEEQKSGFTDNLDELLKSIEKISTMPFVKLMGFMTIGPVTINEKETRTCFNRLYELQQKINAKGFNLPHLSMGMSHDFEWAIGEGATLLRIGSSIFGGRTYSPTNSL